MAGRGGERKVRIQISVSFWALEEAKAAGLHSHREQGQLSLITEDKILGSVFCDMTNQSQEPYHFDLLYLSLEFFVLALCLILKS